LHVVYAPVNVPAMLPRINGLYVITRALSGGPEALANAVDQAVAGGAVMVQYREKNGDEARREQEARAVLETCRRRGVPLVINDDLDLARNIGADGVHLGREDATARAARRALGPHAIVGVSCYNELARAQAAERAGASYVAFGSFFPSPTKPGAVRATPDLLREARERVSLPVCAIGGITPANGGELVAAGADLLAVASGVFESGDILDAAERYAGLFRQASKSIRDA
jgi:thiamine-phosphate pyrophosphorylase